MTRQWTLVLNNAWWETDQTAADADRRATVAQQPLLPHVDLEILEAARWLSENLPDVSWMIFKSQDNIYRIELKP